MLQCGQKRVDSLWATEHDQQATGTAGSRTFNMFQPYFAQVRYAENDVPQPQERVAFGLMKLKPCRISVSS